MAGASAPSPSTPPTAAAANLRLTINIPEPPCWSSSRSATLPLPGSERRSVARVGRSSAGLYGRVGTVRSAPVVHLGSGRSVEAWAESARFGAEQQSGTGFDGGDPVSLPAGRGRSRLARFSRADAEVDLVLGGVGWLPWNVGGSVSVGQRAGAAACARGRSTGSRLSCEASLLPGARPSHRRRLLEGTRSVASGRIAASVAIGGRPVGRPGSVSGRFLPDPRKGHAGSLPGLRSRRAAASAALLRLVQTVLGVRNR